MYVLRQLIKDMRHFLLPSVSLFIFFAHDKRLLMLINPKFEGFSFEDNPNGYTNWDC